MSDEKRMPTMQERLVIGQMFLDSIGQATAKAAALYPDIDSDSLAIGLCTMLLGVAAECVVAVDGSHTRFMQNAAGAMADALIRRKMSAETAH